MPAMSKNRIAADLDSIVLMGYATAMDQKTFVKDFCLEHYHAAPPVMVMMATQVMKERSDFVATDFYSPVLTNRSKHVNPTTRISVIF